MAPISSTLPMSSPSPLIILLSGWFLWGCLFNFANVHPRLHHHFFPPNYICFLHHIAHHIGSFPSFSPWGVTLHLWLAFGPYGDPSSSLHSWWGKNDFAWCCVGCFCDHCKKCEISCFVKTNPCPFTFCSIVFVSSNGHYVINQWCLHVDKCCHC
jgi:hypothetical protein